MSKNETIRDVLVNFMESIEEWASLIPGTPTEGDLNSLDFIYEDAEGEVRRIIDGEAV